MKSTDSLSPRRLLAWKLVRLFVPRRVRWLYEGHPRMRGQLWYAERKLLYEAIRRYKPEHCFEIGTWKGGGSTLFISTGLKENCRGLLHTVEVDKGFYSEAVENYNAHLTQLVKYVSFHLGDYKTVYESVLRANPAVDFLILDGAEDGEQTFEQYNFFLPYFGPGTILVVHDWFTEKTRLIKPILENTPEWEIKSVLMPPASVGIALAVRNKR